MFLAFFLLAASSCCCQKMYWKESFGKSLNNTELPGEDIICFKSPCVSSSRMMPLDSNTFSILAFNRSHCLETKRSWLWSWLRRLTRSGSGWYLYKISTIAIQVQWYTFTLYTQIDLPVVDMAWRSGVTFPLSLHPSILDWESCGRQSNQSSEQMTSRVKGVTGNLCA